MIADLHIHSRYSRATSKTCVPEHLELWARKKGIDLLGTGDFTHPAWRAELHDKLVPAEEGLYRLRNDCRILDKTARGEMPRFVVSGEISSIYKKNGKVRKVHNVILLPGLEQADLLSKKLEAIGNIHSDGRPILGLDSRDLLEITLDTCPEAIFIPAHIWTPHFSLFGAFSGFDSIEECFEDMTPYIHALETGLSSDPAMNWRLSALDGYTLVSNSDAHSPAKLGRETNLLEIPFAYSALRQALEKGKDAGFVGTIEFFPEEGKYHYDGHRNCHLCLKPSETNQFGGKCPICGKKITIGVQHRVEELADREDGVKAPNALPFESLAPLPEVIAASTGMSATSKKVQQQYEVMLEHLGPEFYLLRKAPLEEIRHWSGLCVEEGIRRLRAGDVKRIPGFDGEYGVIQLLDETEIQKIQGQMTFLETKHSSVTQKNKPAVPNKPLKQENQTEEGEVENREQDLLGGLNPQQLQAVMSPAAVTAVIAGPGTGKTKTLVSRIAYLVQRRGVKPAEITAVTFTNQAAEELQIRLEQQLGRRAARAMTIGTFHAICLHDMERKEPHKTLIGEEEALGFAEQTAQECSIPHNAGWLLQEISKWKNGLPADKAVTQDVIMVYQKKLEEAGVLDLDDLLLHSLQEWAEGRQTAKQEKAFRYLLVDEFQDINALQHQLIRSWSRKSASLFVIGDPDQSIYGFRGSDAKCFLHLEQEHPQLEKISLQQNYRSTPEILSCAAALMQADGNGTRLLQAVKESGENVHIMTAQSALSEAIFVAKKINQMVGGIDMLDAAGFARPQKEKTVRSFSEIAVLYRTHRQARIIEQCLAQEGIPFVTVGKDDLLANPVARGIFAFFRFLLCPEDLFSLKLSLQELCGCPISLQEQVLHRFQALQRETMDDMERFKQLEQRFDQVKLFSCVTACFPNCKKKKPLQLLQQCGKILGLEETEVFAGISRMVVLYDNMESFLEAVLLGKERDIAKNASQHYTSDAVTLMTLHGCKGLEFPVVFLCGVNKGTIPLERKKERCDIEEERRLLYVGMTRAQQELYLMTSSEPSLFLKELPETFVCREEARTVKRQQTHQMSMFE